METRETGRPWRTWWKRLPPPRPDSNVASFLLQFWDPLCHYKPEYYLLLFVPEWAGVRRAWYACMSCNSSHWISVKYSIIHNRIVRLTKVSIRETRWKPQMAMSSIFIMWFEAHFAPEWNLSDITCFGENCICWPPTMWGAKSHKPQAHLSHRNSAYC